jgi:catechol 2,3-dioxygenase-like lactoylglutathione lyase family enzyme
MISGAHALIYSTDADATRVFLRDVLGFDWVDAGKGWLIFALPPAGVGVHPTDDQRHHRLHLMCDDLDATMTELSAKGVEFVHPPQHPVKAPGSPQIITRAAAGASFTLS